MPRGMPLVDLLEQIERGALLGFDDALGPLQEQNR
jgi:hypothetical protein